jgi:hypothetical protein
MYFNFYMFSIIIYFTLCLPRLASLLGAEESSRLSLSLTELALGWEESLVSWLPYSTRVTDRITFYRGTRSTLHFDADPDPTFHFHADPDSHQCDANLRPLVFNVQTLQASILSFFSCTVFCISKVLDFLLRIQIKLLTLMRIRKPASLLDAGQHVACQNNADPDPPKSINYLVL